MIMSNLSEFSATHATAELLVGLTIVTWHMMAVICRRSVRVRPLNESLVGLSPLTWSCIARRVSDSYFFVLRRQAGKDSLNLHVYMFFNNFSPVCRPWQLGKCRPVRTAPPVPLLATPLNMVIPYRPRCTAFYRSLIFYWHHLLWLFKLFTQTRS